MQIIIHCYSLYSLLFIFILNVIGPRSRFSFHLTYSIFCLLCNGKNVKKVRSLLDESKSLPLSCFSDYSIDTSSLT